VFTAQSSGLTGIGFNGGSNWLIATISSPGGNCNVTPTNNGGYCGFATPATNLTVTVTVNGPIPIQVTVSVGYPDASTAMITAPVTAGTPVCDWMVQFLAPPTSAYRTPLAYTVKVTNAGNGECPAASLTTKGDITVPRGGGNASFTPATVPALAPGGTAIINIALERVIVNNVGYDWATGKGGVQLTVQATMPGDADGGSDEGATANTKLAWQVALFNPGAPGAIGASCPNGGSGGCSFHMNLFASGTASGMARASSEAVATRPLKVGSASGTVKRGKKGVIHYKLNTAGHQLLKKGHKLAVTLIGTRKQGSKTTLVKGHVTLR
jgi:hypothetical protein